MIEWLKKLLSSAECPSCDKKLSKWKEYAVIVTKTAEGLLEIQICDNCAEKFETQVSKAIAEREAREQREFGTEKE